MELIETPVAEEGPSLPGEYGRLRKIWNRIAQEVWYWRLRRWLPRLVWLNDEVDVTITFTEDALNPNKNPLAQLFGGGLFEIEKQLRHMGIGFDTGMGCDGRDWEWDWSLKGPVRVKFRGRAKDPGRRVREEKPSPKLAAIDGKPAA